MIGLNESVKSTLLKEVCDEIAPVHSIRFHRHPKTKTFLGAATVSFEQSGCGKKAVKELDGKIVGGCYLRAELDDSGKIIHMHVHVHVCMCVCISTVHVLAFFAAKTIISTTGRCLCMCMYIHTVLLLKIYSIMYGIHIIFY